MGMSMETGSAANERIEALKPTPGDSADRAYFELYRQVQALVMLRTYQRMHSDVVVDINNQNANPKELRRKIGQEWLDIYADPFKVYVRDYLKKSLSLEPSKLDALTISFTEFYDKQQKDTVH